MAETLVERTKASARAGSAAGAKTGSGHPRPDRDTAMGYLRASMVALVVIHHSVLAYVQGMPLQHRFAGGAMLWRAFPVLDAQRWGPAGLIAGVNDTFFMSLMFLLSGLFVWRGLSEGGAATFLRRRTLRLGLPFIVSAGLVMPIAYYAAYLQSGGAPGLANYWRAWSAIGYWPTGPAWFVLLLLAFDWVAAALFLIDRQWGRRIAALTAGAAERPLRLFALVVALSIFAYAPLAWAFGPSGWTYWGLLQFQTSRPLHYFLWFVVGIGLGAYGADRGLLSGSGALTRRWFWWVAGAVAAFALGAAVLVLILTSKGEAQKVWINIGSISFALTCASSCFAFLAVYSRFARRPNRFFDSLDRNSYGIYLVHYAFVAWLQFALLPANLAAPFKVLSVIVGALAGSWLLSASLRRIPAVAQVV